MANTVTLNADGTGTVVLDGIVTQVASSGIDQARKELLGVVIAHARSTRQVVELLARDPQAEHMLQVHPDGMVTAGSTPPDPEELRLSVTAPEQETARPTTSPDLFDTSRPLTSQSAGEVHATTLPQEPVHTSTIPTSGRVESGAGVLNAGPTHAVSSSYAETPSYTDAPSYEETPAAPPAPRAANAPRSGGSPVVDAEGASRVGDPGSHSMYEYDRACPATKTDPSLYDPDRYMVPESPAEQSGDASSGLGRHTHSSPEPETESYSESAEPVASYRRDALGSGDLYAADRAAPYASDGLDVTAEPQSHTGNVAMTPQPTRNPDAPAASVATGPHTAALSTTLPRRQSTASLSTVNQSAPQPTPAQTEPRTSAEDRELDHELPPADAEPVPASGRSFLTVHEDNSPAGTGWRGLLAKMGLNSEPSEEEKAYRADARSVSSHWPGPRTIAIVNGKGGSGKTPTTVLLSAIFARYGGSGVLAWDNNETRGTLGWRTEQGTHESHVLTMLPRTSLLMEPTARAADLAAFVHHQTVDKFDVLRSNPAMLPHQQRLTAGNFDAVHAVASKYYRLVFVDSGNDETAPHWLRMIDHTHQIVVATTTRPDHAEAGRLLLEALRHRDPHSADLAEKAVVVVSQADREEASAKDIAEGFKGLSRAAITVPYDRAMRAPWLRYDNLQRATQRAYLRVAASVASGL